MSRREELLGDDIAGKTFHDELAYTGPPYEERFKKGETLDREHDTTQLRYEHLRHQPHKDYIGHVFRWGFVTRHVKRDSRLLDVGCGQDFPMLLALGGSSMTTIPTQYVGVDMNPLPNPPKRKWARVHAQTDVVKARKKLALLYGDFNLISCLEVYEHVAPQLALGFLRALRELASADGKLILSTPVYSHRFKMARNHINERTKAEMEDDLARAGWKIVGQYGTFGNVQDYRPFLSEVELMDFERQREFYGDDVLGCFLAPRFPQASRNITHICVPDSADVVQFTLLPSVVS